MSMMFGPTGDPTLDRLAAFIEAYRSRMDDENTNLFTASAGAWSRYHAFLGHVLARHDRSNAEYVEAQKRWIGLAMRPEAAGTFRPMTPEDMVAWKQTADLATVLHLDIETFYLFAKILLDRTADTFGLVFGVKWRSGGSSYSDLSKRFAGLCREKGLETRPDNLPALISKLWEAVVDYRNKMIEHLVEPLMPGTLTSPGQASSIATGRGRQTEDPHALLRTLEEYVEAMLTLFEVNAKKSPPIVS